MVKLFNLLMASLAILVAVTACDENEIGMSTIDSDSYTIVDSSFTLQGSTVAAGKIQSRTLTQLLGVISSPEYGTLRSDFVTEFMPSSVIDTAGVSASDIDSVNIMFQVPIGSYTGDSITPMKVNVYRLKKNLEYPIYSDFNPEDYYDRSDLLGSKSYSMTTLNRDSALYYKYDSNGNEVVIQPIVVGLPKSLGVDLFNKYLSDPEIFKNPEAFAQYFPGIYATTSYGNGRVVKITTTAINLYYKQHAQTEEGNDTTYSQSKAYLGVSPEIVTNNNISFTPSETLRQMVENGRTVITAPTGYAAEVKLPVNALLARYNELSDGGQTVVNTITLTIPATEIENGEGIDPPDYLLLVKSSEKDEFFMENKVPDYTTSYYAAYDSSSKSYTFSGIRSYLKSIIDGEIEIDEAVEDFSIVPVDMEFQESTNSSYYYSYYYSYSSAATTPTKVTPQVSSPAMVALDIDKAKIIATFSKKDFRN